MDHESGAQLFYPFRLDPVYYELCSVRSGTAPTNVCVHQIGEAALFASGQMMQQIQRHGISALRVNEEQIIRQIVLQNILQP